MNKRGIARFLNTFNLMFAINQDYGLSCRLGKRKNLLEFRQQPQPMVGELIFIFTCVRYNAPYHVHGLSLKLYGS